MGLFSDLIVEAMAPTHKPKVPGAPNVNPQGAQRDSIAGNKAALPGLEDLASDTNEFNVGQRRSMLEGAIPGYENLTGSASDLLSGWLNGQLSPDVASAVRRNSNARAVGGGYGGSGMGDALQARDLGLTSLDLEKMGASALPGYLGTMSSVAMPRQFDPAAGFISPAEQIGAQQWNETNRYGRDWLQNQLDAVPDPGKLAIAKDLGGMADTAASMIPYVGAFYSMSQGGAGGGTGGGMRDIGMGGGWLDSLFGGSGAGSSPVSGQGAAQLAMGMA